MTMATSIAGGTFYTSAEAATYLGITESLVCRYCRLGRIEGQKAGRDWIIRKSALDKFNRIPREAGNPAFKAQSR